MYIQQYHTYMQICLAKRNRLRMAENKERQNNKNNSFARLTNKNIKVSEIAVCKQSDPCKVTK